MSGPLRPGELLLLNDPRLARRLRRPLGLLIRGPPHLVAERIRELAAAYGPACIITVGDFVTANLLRHGMKPDVAIVDHRTARRPVRLLKAFARVLTAINPPGCITWEAWSAICRALIGHEETLIRIIGEEDLLTLAAIYLAPEYSFLIYGQPGEGAVLVLTSPGRKDKIRAFLQLMERRRVSCL